MRKNYQKAIVAATAFLAMTLSTSAFSSENLWEDVQAAGVLKVGCAIADPHVIKDPKTGEYSGVAVDVLRELAKHLEVELQCVDTTWDHIISGMLAKKWDIAIALNRTPKRSLVINYSEPYTEYQITLVYNKNNSKIDSSWTSLEDFDKEGIVISLMSGTAQDHSITPEIQNATISRLPDFDSSRMAVISKRADVLADDGEGNILFALSNSEWSATVVPDPAIAKQGVGYGFRSSVSLADIQTLNIVIEELRAKGIIANWMESYIQDIIARSK